QAKRQGADRERGGDGTSQSGRSNVRTTAFEAGRAGRPHHLLILVTRVTNHPATHDVRNFLQRSRATIRRPNAENGGITAKVNVVPAIVNLWRPDRAKVRRPQAWRRLSVSGDAGLVVDLYRLPVHGDEAGGLLDPPQP